MSKVLAPRYLAGLVSTHGYLRSRHLCQTLLNGSEAYPARTWLLSWNRAIQIQIQIVLEAEAEAEARQKGRQQAC